jgi:tripartite-type tricarboxylate transporter receptor subunit TctC
MAGASAQNFPDKPLRMIVPFPPGGGTDLLARPIAQVLGDRLGQSVIVDNRGGGGGMIGADVVAKSTPDGYTVMMATSAEVALNVAVYGKMTYDPARDFAPVTEVAISPLVLAVPLSLPARDVKEFIALAKKKPGMTYASGGAGGPHNVAGEWMKLIAHVDITHVPYRGGGPLLTDLMGGHVDSAIAALPVVVSQVKAGRLRALAVTSVKRTPALPDVPTLDESGLTGLDVSQWWGVFLPAGSPRNVIARLHKEIVDIIKLPAVAARMADLGAEPVGSTPQQLRELVRSEIEKYRKIVKATNLKID